jgi:hypothetical protein
MRREIVLSGLLGTVASLASPAFASPQAIDIPTSNPADINSRLFGRSESCHRSGYFASKVARSTFRRFAASQCLEFLGIVVRRLPNRIADS